MCTLWLILKWFFILAFLSLYLYVLNFYLFLYIIIFCEIMDDGRPYMWTCFIMEDEMTTIVAPPLVWLLIVKCCHKRKKMDDETNLEGGEMVLLLLTSLIYMKRSGNVLANLVCRSNIGHTFALKIMINCWISVITKKNKSITKSKRWKVSTNVIFFC